LYMTTIFNIYIYIYIDPMKKKNIKTVKKPSVYAHVVVMQGCGVFNLSL